MISLLDRLENTVGKGENAFTPFPTMFSKDLFPRDVKCRDCMVKVKQSNFKNLKKYC